MAVSIKRRLGAAAVLAAALAAFAIPVPAQAAPDFVLVLPAGVACDFELEVSGTGGPTVTKEFTDGDGNLVRTLTAGRGTALTFRNVSTDATVSLKSNGSVIQHDHPRRWIIDGAEHRAQCPDSLPQRYSGRSDDDAVYRSRDL